MDIKASVLTSCLLISLCRASIIPTVKVLQGPGSKTVLLGPDGGAIDSVAPGGTVVTDDHGSGLVAAGPAALPLGPEILVNGPAGSIATSYSNAGPAVVPAVVPAVAVAPALAPAAAVAVGVGAVAPVYGEDNGYEGAYVPENIGLYDDGSYRGEH